jgi:site-specific DNA-methyltransferase (adenine-specific)
VTPFFSDWDVSLYLGDALDVLASLDDASCDSVVTSPPYLDARPEYPSPSADSFSDIFQELRRVCTGTMLLNVGRLWRDSQELLWWLELVERAREEGWPHRDTLIWVKENANPFQGELLTNAHEYVFLFGDGFDTDAVRTPYAEESLRRMKRRFLAHAGVKNDVNVDGSMEEREANEKGARGKSFVIYSTGKEKGNEHPAPMPLDLAEYLVRLSGGTRILDPFAGSGTTLLAARRLGRRALGIELSPEYAEMCAARMSQQTLPIEEVE